MSAFENGQAELIRLRDLDHNMRAVWGRAVNTLESYVTKRITAADARDRIVARLEELMGQSVTFPRTKSFRAVADYWTDQGFAIEHTFEHIAGTRGESK